jgi:disulfide bond formation protein DsbB
MPLTSLSSQTLKSWPLVALVTSLAMLGAAHAFETFGNMPPCALCLHQREAYWAAVAVSLLALVAAKFRPDRLSQRAFGLLLICAFGAGALIAGFHVGVEFKWWPGLAECAAGGKYEPSGDILGALSQSMDVPSCDKVAWSLFGISMAGWNMLVSLGLVVLSALFIAFPQGFKEEADV